MTSDITFKNLNDDQLIAYAEAIQNKERLEHIKKTAENIHKDFASNAMNIHAAHYALIDLIGVDTAKDI